MLTDEEKELIVSALAFASTPDVVADFNTTQELVMSELVVKLREGYELDELESVYLPYKSERDLDQYGANTRIAQKYVDFIRFD